MNTGMLCESLCLPGHSDMADSHISHDMMPHTQNESSKTQACPISKTHNHSDNEKSKTFIKCDCPSDNDSLLDYNFNLSTSVDLTPYLQVASNIQPYSIAFTNTIRFPLEKPPKILA